MALWLPSVLVKVEILLANKGINSQGILGIFIVSFGNDLDKGEQFFRVLSKLFSILLLIKAQKNFQACLTALNWARLLSEPDDGYY